MFTVLSLNILQFHYFGMIVHSAAFHIKGILQFGHNKPFFSVMFI